MSVDYSTALGLRGKEQLYKYKLKAPAFAEIHLQSVTH